MNISLITQSIILITVVVSAVRCYKITYDILRNHTARLGSLFDQVQRVKMKHEMVEVELIKIQDRFIVLQRELYILKKPAKKKPTDKKKAIKVKAPDISVDAITRGK